MDRIAIFARYPTPGAVKTRLTPALPADLALGLHTAMLADAMDAAILSGVGPVTLWWASAPPEGPRFPVPAEVIVRDQRGADLGERLAAAFAELLGDPNDRAVIAGADCPDLAPGALRAAFAALDRHDLALGPARDGGYVLIGLRHPAPALFAGVTWGTHRVLAETLTRARGEALRVSLLDPLEDLDTPADLVRFVARRCVAAPGTGARTEAALREMGLLPPRG